jgi:signal transduction histidine kinase
MTGKSLEISSSHNGETQQQDNRPPPAENESRIISSLAHEMNNPLEALHQLHYLIETERTLQEKGRQYLSLARDEVHRISQILHAAMELRDSGDPEDTNLPKLLSSVLDFYASRLAFQGISVQTRYSSGEHLSAYPRQLRQMYANLLLNAADAMPKGGKIYARIVPAHEWNGGNRSGLRLTIADTGCGIAARDLARMWDPFFTTKGPAGNGIGLSLVKNTVLKHSGVLRVRSSTRADHSGTVFSIFLPCA